MPFTYECAGCEKQVTRVRRRRGARTFCSQACYQRSSIKYPDRECPGCGQTFSPRRGSRSGPRAGRIDRTYCSYACFQAGRADPVTKTCPVCGKDFTLQARVAKGRRTCSAACFGADAVYVNCERCGKRFRGERRLSRRHCSEECRRPPVLLACRNCGKQFRKVPSEAARLGEGDVNAARDLPWFITDRIREVVGLDLTNLAPGVIHVQMTLWDDEEVA